MKRLLGVLVATGAICLATSAPAFSQGSGASNATPFNPFARCVGVGTSPTGTNYPDTEPEPWLARNRAFTRNFAGTIQQDRWSDGGAKGLIAAFSFNGGESWRDVALPFSKCAVPYYSPSPCPTDGTGSTRPCTLPYDRASDPWNDFGPDGKGYAVSISFNANDNANAVGAATTTDGGAHWGQTTEISHISPADQTFPFNDKEAVTADPIHPGTAYVVWDRLVLVACGPGGAGPNRPQDDDHAWAGDSHLASPSSHAAAPLAPQALDCFEGPAMLSKTTDGGAHWSAPRVIVGNLPDEQTIGNQIVVDPRTGRLYDFYTYFASSGVGTEEVVFSDDGGTTWSARQVVNTLESVGIHDPQTGALARTSDFNPEPAIDERSGQLYVTWQDGRFNPNGQDDVVISTAPAMTATTGSWTAPQPVDTPQDRAGFTEAVKANTRGQVGVEYYSMRPPDDGTQVWPIERYLRITGGPAAISGGTATFGFGSPIRTSRAFNMLMAPQASGGFFTGDYEGLALDERRGTSFRDFVGKANCNDASCPAMSSADGSPPRGQRRDPFDVYSVQVDVFGGGFGRGGGPGT
jgi:hypothetical protein